MSEVYNKELQDVIRKAGTNTGVALKEGVYMQFTGPSYETPAEIRMYCLPVFGDT
jgi:purine-nucleoside phosphorylase